MWNEKKCLRKWRVTVIKHTERGREWLIEQKITEVDNNEYPVPTLCHHSTMEVRGRNGSKEKNGRVIENTYRAKRKSTNGKWVENTNF